MKLLIVLFVWCSAFVKTNQNDNFYQNTFTASFDRVSLDRVDERLLNPSTAESYKFNRTVTIFKVSFYPKVIMNAVKFHYKIFKFLNMDYKFVGIQSTVDGCSALKNNYYGVRIFKDYGNFTNCPISPGYYEADGLTIDSSKLPPLFPEGKYKIELNAFMNDVKESAATFTALASVNYPLKTSKRNN